MTSIRVVLGGLQKLSLIDYPGKIAATIFTSGCCFRCAFCYNPELVLPAKIEKHPKILEKELFKFLKERVGLLQGVVLTGGEPTIHKDLPNFIKKIKKLGYQVKLDTNGSNPNMLEKLINNNLVDYVAMDIKAPPQKYTNTIGAKMDIKKIQKSIDILMDGKIDYEFRSTIVPTIHKKEDVIAMAMWIKGAKKYYLQNFRPEKTLDPRFETIKPYPQKYLLVLQKIIAPFFDICEIR